MTTRSGLIVVVALATLVGASCSTHPNIEFAAPTVSTPVGTPLVPQVVSVTAGYGAIGASWLPASPGEAVTDYRVLVATTSWSTWSAGLPGAVVTTAGCCSAVLAGVQNERDYFVGVTARNAFGQSDSSIPKRVHPPGWQGTQTVGGFAGFAVLPSGLIVDTNGNLFSTGYFTDSLSGDVGAFLSKIDASGRLRWIQPVEVNPFHEGYAISRSPDGDLVLAGSSGDGGYPGFANGASGANKYAVAKVAADGVTKWAEIRGATTTESDVAYGVATDSSGDIFVVGTTNANLDSQTNHGGTDAFVAKFDRDGNWIWTKLIGTTGTETGKAVAIDSANGIYVIGTTTGTLDGNSNPGADAAFVEKLDVFGNALWTPASRLFASVIPNAASVDESGNLYVGGYNAGILVMSVAGTGTLRWSKVLQTTPSIGQYDYVFATRHANGSLYCAGITNGDFGGGVDAFVASLDPASGNLNWSSLAFAGPLSDYATGVDVDTDGEVYVTGLDGWGTYTAMFAAKLDPDGVIENP